MALGFNKSDTRAPEGDMALEGTAELESKIQDRVSRWVVVKIMSLFGSLI